MYSGALSVVHSSCKRCTRLTAMQGQAHHPRPSPHPATQTCLSMKETSQKQGCQSTSNTNTPATQTHQQHKHTSTAFTFLPICSTPLCLSEKAMRASVFYLNPTQVHHIPMNFHQVQGAKALLVPATTPPQKKKPALGKA